MTKPRWYSQPFPPAGSISAEGIKRTLGKPPLPWPAILVRESAQNSWDARLGDRPVEFTLDLGIVSPQHASSWTELLSEGAPHSDKFPLRRTLRGREGHSPLIRTLTISDRGTKGLGGPTRADTARGDEPRDWVSFVLNVGDPPDTKNGGGTYGYGKGILYQMSRAGTIIVQTRTRTSEGFRNRLIGICLGESVELPFTDGCMRPHTGRHWWGSVESSHVEPLTGQDAVSVASALGLRSFGDDETGTDVVVVDPEFGQYSDEQTAEYLADSTAWNLWPIMLQDRGDERLVAEVRLRGVDVPVPVPEKSRGLKTFVAAYRRLNAGTDVRTLACGNPKKNLGQLALERQLIPTFEPPAAAQDLGITSAPHHVCLLRSPELVVSYHAGPEPISTNLAYAGVFRAFDDMDRVYAAAEPPTHDAWVFAQLDGHERTFVRTTFVRLKERLAEFARPAEIRTENLRAPLGAASNFLGSLVAAAGGTGAAPALLPAQAPGGEPTDEPIIGSRGAASEAGEPTSSAPAGVRTRGRAALRLEGEPYFDDVDSELLLLQGFSVIGTGPLSARGTADIVMADGTREQEPPESAERPRVVGWRNGGATTDGDLLTLADATPGTRVTLMIRAVVDTVTQVGVVVLGGEGGSDGK
ncbi:hypothetical protein [Actinoplanes sp. NPDC049681]|uniref:hypothetical protein n=1 Tax=Actinoplanes sp. NPDC049681 TaxID=3363905 RepID=UPI00379FCE82